MKKLYPSGRAMPTRTGSSEPTRSSYAASNQGATIGRRSIQSPKSVSPFNSYRRRGMVCSPPATSNLYDVLKKVDWLAIFSPWAIINRSKMYAMTTKQYTSATRTPANNAVLQNFEKTNDDAEPVVSNRACELTEGNIIRSTSQRDTDTSATRTPAKNVALQNFEKMHEDAEPVVSKFFSDEFFAFFFAEKKKVPVRHEDKEIVEWEYISRRFATVSAPFSSTLFLLSTIFVLLNFGFISATHAQSRQDVGAAEVVVMGEVRSAVDGQPLEGVVIRLRNQTRITDAQGEF